MARKMHTFLIGIELLLLVTILYQLNVLSSFVPFFALVLISAALAYSLYLLALQTNQQ
jgi:uncharacterized membrane protein